MFDMIYGRKWVEVDYDLAEEYPAVYRDDTCLATWLRLLMIAQGVWPAPAMLPRSTNDAAVVRLASEGLIEVDGDSYRVRGLDKRRRAQSERNSENAKKRWESDTARNASRNAGAVQGGMPHNIGITQHSSPSLEGTQPLSVEDSSFAESDERTEIQKRDDERFDVGGIERPEAFIVLALKAEELTGSSSALRNPLGGYAQQLLALVAVHTVDAVLGAMDQVGHEFGRVTIRELVQNTEALLSRKINGAAAAKSQRVDDEAAQVKRRVERTQLNLHFQHIDPETHPLCPACRGEVAAAVAPVQ